ncbi:MAG: Holliday junction branch migration protein RuvA [Patescibacteria group bacterium]
MGAFFLPTSPVTGTLGNDMIGSLRGAVLEIHPTFLLLEVQGIGYAVKASSQVLTTVRPGSEFFIYTHDHVREDAHDLYGFATRSEQELFERLLSVSGVGPKVALSILSAGPFDSVRRAIMAGNLDMLTSMPGIGKKTAQKIILELKGQLVEEESMPTGDGEVLEALVSLGYSREQAREALKAVPSDITDVSLRVREALRHLAK